MSFDYRTISTRKVSIDDLTRFLIQHGFQQLGSWGRFLQRYSLEIDGRQFDVLVPTTNDISDYEGRIRDAVTEIAHAIDREPSEIVRLLTFSEHRIFKVRARPGRDIASLPYEEGIGIILNGWKMIKSSAVSAMSLKARKVIRGRVSDRVDDYMDKVRLGQTEIGSFVFNFLLPDSTNFATIGNEEFENFDPVSSRLFEGIAFAGQNLQARRVPASSVLESLELPANFFEAFYNVIDFSDEVELQVASFRKEEKIRSESFRFDRSYLSVLERTAVKLAPEEKRVKKTISGTITRLSEPAKRRRGSIDLLAKIDNRRRTIRIRFEAEHRDTVIDAFKEKDSKLLAVSGYLRTQRSGHLVLEQANSFRSFRRGSLL